MYNFSESRFDEFIHELGKRSKHVSKEGQRLLDKIKPGDGLEIDRGFYRHYGVYLGNNVILELNGSTSGKNKSRLIDADTFLLNQKASDVTAHKSHKFTLQQIRERAKNAINHAKLPYNLVTNNCEHFMEEILNGKHESHQVKSVGTYASTISRGIGRHWDSLYKKNSDKKKKFYRSFL